MRLWTIQSLTRWERLQRDGVLRAERVNPEDFCPGAYGYMRDELTKRVGPAPHEDGWMLWAWCRYDGFKRPRPDLRRMHIDEPSVRLTLELPQQCLLLSDYSLWHMPLNCGPIFDEWEQVESFDEELKAAGFDIPLSWKTLDNVLAHPDFGKRMRDSWNRIFELDWHQPNWTCPPEEKSVQAVFWELRSADVRRCEFIQPRKADKSKVLFPECSSAASKDEITPKVRG